MPTPPLTTDDKTQQAVDELLAEISAARSAA